MMTTADVATVAAHYKQVFTAAGWTMGDSMEGGGTSILQAKKGSQDAAVMIAGAAGQTSITIGISETDEE